MIALVLVKKDIMYYVQDMRAVRRMNGTRSVEASSCKVRLGNACIKRREATTGAGGLDVQI